VEHPHREGEALKMATAITVRKLAAVLRGNYAITYADLLALAKDFDIPDNALSFAYGTAVGQINRLYIGERPIAANTNDDVDLSGVLLDPGGVAINFARIKFAILSLRPTPATPFLTVGNEGTNPAVLWFGAAAHTIQVRNGPDGGLFVNACGDATGWTVTAATADKLRVRNPDATLAADYVLCLGGCDV
jgi:hypothetical protein